MAGPLEIDILPQPDETTCGPTCLHAVYRYYQDEMPLYDVINGIQRLDHGGTLAVFLATHALERGYRATIYTYNLEMFDPTWFDERDSVPDIAERLRRQANAKAGAKLALATEGYTRFLAAGGRLRFEDLTTGLIRRYLKRGIPLLTGLSATHLYRCAREHGPHCDYDDIRGYPSGHFVLLAGYEAETRSVLVIDPLHTNPMAPGHRYEVSIERVMSAILLGVLTHDANLLVIEPAHTRHSVQSHVDIHSRQ